MARYSSRILVGIVLGVLFVYLSLNVSLNISSLRASLSNQLEERTAGQVEVGFFFLNWEMKPVLQSLSIKTGGVGRDSATVAQLRHIKLDVNWFTFFGMRSNTGVHYINRATVNDAEIFCRLDDLGHSNLQGSLFPGFPLEIRRWSAKVNREGVRLLQFAGQSLRFESPGKPIKTRLAEYQNSPAKGNLTLQKQLDHWKGHAVLERISFSEKFWPLRNDRWSGRVRMNSETDTTTFRVDLEGTPGQIVGRNLPDVSLESRISLGSRSLQLDQLSFQSPYLQSKFSGHVNLLTEVVQGEGDFSFNMRSTLSQYLKGRFDNRLRIRKADTMSGTVALRGPMAEPKVSGGIRLPGLQLSTHETEGESTTYTVRSLRGVLRKERIEMVGGRLNQGDNTFSLESGFIELKNGRITSSLTGMLGLPSSKSLKTRYYPEGASFLQYFRGINFPMNISATLGPRNIESVFAVKDGEVQYGDGVFQDINVIVSHSSSTETTGKIRGRIRDVDGNQWTIDGSVGGAVAVEAELNRINKWLSLLTPELQNPPEVSFSGITVRGRIPSLNRLNQATFRLARSENSSITYRGSTVPLSGNASADSSGLNLESLRIGPPANYLRLDGTISHESSLLESRLGLTVTSNRFQFGPFVPPRWGDLEGIASSQLDVNGALNSPRVEGSITLDNLKYRFLSFENLGLDLTRSSQRTFVRITKGQMNRSNINGTVSVKDTGLLKSNLEIKSSSIATLFPDGSWMNQHAGGELTGNIRLKGPLSDTTAWKGRIKGRFKHLILDHFPKIEGIEQVARPRVLEEPIVIDPHKFKFPVRNGLIQVRNMTLESSGMKLNIAGNGDLKGDLDLRLDLILIGETLRGFLQDILGDFYRGVGLSDDTKTLTIPLVMTGPVESPQLSVRESELSKNFRKNLIKGLFSEPIGGPINELLDEIF